MVNHPIHWAEGALLSPHHFQAADRNLREEVELAEDWNIGYPYGLRAIDIDEEALANWRVSLRKCHARFHDGTHFRYPESAMLTPIDIPKDVFASPDARVMVWLAVPSLQLGRRNAGAQDDEAIYRYGVDAMEVEDENEIGRAETVDVRWLQSQLMLGDQDTAGYETLPLMRLKLGTTAEAPPTIDDDYIPPVLACDAWSRLHDGIIANIYDYVGSVADEESRQMIDRGVGFQSGHKEDLERILRLHAMNASLGYLSVLPFVRGVHPLQAYMQLAHVVGLLAIFRDERRMPQIPKYDHDDLATCFYRLRNLIKREREQERYIRRDFVGAGRQMQIRLEREWLEPEWSFYLGVESSLAFNEVDRMLNQRLDLKVAAAELVENIFMAALASVKLHPEPQAPRVLPQTRWTYWRMDRSSEAWKDVEKTLNLGIRFNVTQVEGDINGQRRVLIKAEDGRPIDLSFSCFAMPKRSG